MATSYDHDVRISLGSGPTDCLVTIVGSQSSSCGILLEEALILKAVGPLLQQFPSENGMKSQLKVRILTGNSTEEQKMAMEVIALNAGFPRGTVEHVVGEDMDSLLGMADLVIYGSFLEDRSFPGVLIKAMNLEKLIITPDLIVIRKYVDDRVNGFLFPRENIGVLTQVLLQAVSNGKLSLLGQKVVSVRKAHARNIMGYALLLENVIKFLAEVLKPGTAE